MYIFITYMHHCIYYDTFYFFMLKGQLNYISFSSFENIVRLTTTGGYPADINFDLKL